MSLTVICFAIAAPSLILSVVLAILSEHSGWSAGLPAIILFATSLASIVIGVSSYNENLRETTNREKVACVEAGKEILRYNGADYCVEPGSKIIRTL